jgi:hypothetical protein
MLALIYLGSAIALGDLVCRRFYRFISIFHRWAAAILVGIFLSTWFTCLAGLAFAQIGEALLCADLLFFLTAPGAIFWLSRKAPKVSTIAPRAAGSSAWDWVTLGALFAAACVLLIGTLYVNKQGRIRLSGMEASDFGPQAAIAQGFAIGHSFPTEFARYARQPAEFLFFFQAGNLEFLGLNLAWSVDVLSMLVLMSVLALVMTLGELLFNSRFVGRLGATLFFLHGSLRHLNNFLASGHPDSDQTWGFWKQIAFVNHRHLSLAIGIFLLVLIFLVDRYRQRSSAPTTSDAKIALAQSKPRHDWNQAQEKFCLEIYRERQARSDVCKEFCFFSIASSCAATLEGSSLYSHDSGAVLSVSSLRLLVAVEGKGCNHVRPSAGRHSDSLYFSCRSHRFIGCLQWPPHGH